MKPLGGVWRLVSAGPVDQPPAVRLQVDREVHEDGGRPTDQIGARSTLRQLGQVRAVGQQVTHRCEGFDDIVKYHPTHEESPVAPRDAVPRMMTAPVESLRAAIQKKDAQGFEPAFDAPR